MDKNATEQALEAFIAEAKKSGIDVDTIANNAKVGIMENDIYSWISSLEKTNAVEALENAVTEVSKINA